jgi:tRNA-binding EMAP/Myf-like protein
MSDEKQKKSKKKSELHEVWKREIETSLTYHEKYFEEAEKYEDIYRDTFKHGSDNRYNVFFANTETLAPLVYSRLPKPNITRRFKDEDDIAKITSEILERAVTYFLDITKADNVFAKARKDFLIVGRGLVRVYMEDGEIIEMEDGEEVVDNTNKKIYPKKVKWKDFITDPTATDWTDLKWIAFRCYKTEDELIDLFGNNGKDIKLDSSLMTDVEPESAELWEIWDKVNNQVVWFSQEKIIQVDEDPYEINGFFPMARPTGSDSDPSSILPIPLYRMYKSQAEELNTIDARIKSLVEQSKVCGVYNTISEGQDIKNILNGEDGEYAPLSGIATGNIKDMIFTKDINPIINAIAQLNDQKARVINNIREITGLSDIVRGVSIASETATAQRLKGDFAISRIQPLQKANETAIKDTVEIMSEMIAENYSIEELLKITNCRIVDLESVASNTRENQTRLLEEAISNLPENLQGKERVEQVELLKEQAKKGFDKTMKIAQDELKGFAIEIGQIPKVEKMLTNDKLRSFSIDIETDSTISVDQQQEKQDRIEFIGTITNFATQFFPLLQAGMIQPEAFNEFLGFAARPFKVGRNLEGFLLAKPEEQEEEQPSQEAILAQAENERKDKEFQFKVESEKAKINIEQQKVDIEKAKVLQGQIQFEDKIDFEDANKAADRQSRLLEKVAPTGEEVIKNRTDRVNQTINNGL